MRFPPEFLDELRSRLSLADIIGQKVKLAKKGREFMGLCPFHSEKTPSFTVSEEKGFYHCFGCGAHGDAIRFLTDAEGVPFPEAVERLASKAGMPLPERTREDVEADKKRATLYDVMDVAARWFVAQLGTQAGLAARDYVKKRGLTSETISRFSIGYSPKSRSALKDAMLARKFSDQQLIDCGLVIKPDDGGASYDRFRDRLMFPILDPRGRVIAFGGRGLSKDVKAKYLNSPDTPLFHKGRVLYNLSNARKPAMDAGEVIVCEGYMDVIALAQAGFDNAVAPLGTAVTEDQLALLWRMAPEPTLCLDGDTAGLRAAGRAIERALPMLKAGYSLKIALLPEGDDPDSLVGREGAGAFRQLLAKAETLSGMLWHNLTDGVDASTPERRAGLERKIYEALSHIEDEKVRQFYQRDYKDRLFQMFRPPRRSGFKQGAWKKGGKGGGRPGFPKAPSGGLIRTRLGRVKGEGLVSDPFVDLLLLTAISHPELMVTHLEDLASLVIRDVDMNRFREAIVDIAAHISPLDCSIMKNHLVEKGFESIYTRLTNTDSLTSVWSAMPDAAPSDAEKGWVQTLKRYRHVLALRNELQELERELALNFSDEGYDRFHAILLELAADAGDETDVEGYGLASNRNMSY